MANLKTVRIHGQPSWRFDSDRVAAAVTQLGGHLGPVRFRLPQGAVEPFSVAPWAEEKIPAGEPGVLRACRGDFFCAPFGGGDKPYRGEKVPIHGETANSTWKFESLVKNKLETVLHLSLRTKVRKGCVDKFVRLRRGETALYCRHVLSHMTGKMTYGHHAILKFPEAPGSGLISMSPISYAQVAPLPVEDPAKGGYQSLKPGAVFSRLDRVPALDGSVADLSSYPARRGFEDIVMIAHEAAPDFAWTAVTFPKERYVWFALKDPRVLTGTVFWISNGGRHYAPWNGRHIGVMGIEDVTSFFPYGIAASAEPNAFSKRGVATCVDLKPFPPLVVNYIMGVAPIPAKWGPVKAITRTANGVTLQATGGRDVFAPVDVEYLYSPADDFVAC
ncbi:MAG TPA: hypothetical protein VHY09_15065 [Candidatus Methylacidiphilales bacterium]|nr:hypothetical protein [Candidatus Methylacidiphilales bacterium]